MRSRYSVRRLRQSDLDVIFEIENASFGGAAYDRNLFAELFRNCGDLFLVAERENTVCGYAVTCVRGEQAELVSIAVAPRTRGHGAGSALLESTLRRLRRRRIPRLRLMVRVANCPARAFYEKYGFAKVRVVRGYYEDGGDGLLLSRSI